MNKEKEEKRNGGKHYGVGYLLRNMAKKHRISFRDHATDSEVWYTYVSSWRILLTLLGILLVMFVTVIAVVVYTPVLDRLPGNPGAKTRELLTENIMRLDSLENQLDYLRRYGENVSLIMEGKVQEPQVEDTPATSPEGRVMIAASVQDSLLRLQIEADERYLLNTAPIPAGGGHTPLSFFISPVEASITTGFSPVDGMYGIGYTITEPQQVVAAREGTVVMATWTPSDDYIVQLQHKDNTVTTYRRMGELLKRTGDHVEEGEAIGYVNVSAAEDGVREFIFELWYDGRAIDPRSFITY